MLVCVCIWSDIKFAITLLFVQVQVPFRDVRSADTSTHADLSTFFWASASVRGCKILFSCRCWRGHVHEVM